MIVFLVCMQKWVKIFICIFSMCLTASLSLFIKSYFYVILMRNNQSCVNESNTKKNWRKMKDLTEHYVYKCYKYRLKIKPAKLCPEQAGTVWWQCRWSWPSSVMVRAGEAGNVPFYTPWTAGWAMMPSFLSCMSLLNRFF